MVELLPIRRAGDHLSVLDSSVAAAVEVVGDWRLWMEAAEMSQRTISARLAVLALLAARLCVDPVTATWQDVARFLTDDRLGPASRSTYYGHLRSWFCWLVLNDYRSDNPTDRVRRPRVPRGQPRPITTDQLGRLLASGIYARTRMMVLLAAYEGMRVHEIAKIRGEHLRGGNLTVVGKGGRTDVLPVHEAVAHEAQRFPNIGLWFPRPSDRSLPVLANSVSNVLSKAMQRAGVPGTPHALRHWFGTHALRAAGGDLRVAQELMRHASPATTAIYTLVDDDRRRAAIDALPAPIYRLK